MDFNIFPVLTCKNQNCTEDQSIHLFPLYFGVFSCRCETYPIDFISLSKSLRCESYPIQKSCRIIRFKWKQEAYPI